MDCVSVSLATPSTQAPTQRVQDAQSTRRVSPSPTVAMSSTTVRVPKDSVLVCLDFTPTH